MSCCMYRFNVVLDTYSLKSVSVTLYISKSCQETNTHIINFQFTKYKTFFLSIVHIIFSSQPAECHLLNALHSSTNSELVIGL